MSPKGTLHLFFMRCDCEPVDLGCSDKGTKFGDEWKTSPLSSLIHEEEEACTVEEQSHTRGARPKLSGSVKVASCGIT